MHLAPARDVELSRLGRALYLDERAVLMFARQLDLLHAVRARGQRRARHDAHGLALTHYTAPAAPRRGLADDAQTRGQLAQVRRAHRVAVHLRAVERRQVCVGQHVFGQHPTRGVGERDALDLKQRALLSNDADCFRDWNHTGGILTESRREESQKSER